MASVRVWVMFDLVDNALGAMIDVVDCEASVNGPTESPSATTATTGGVLEAAIEKPDLGANWGSR